MTITREDAIEGLKRINRAIDELTPEGMWFGENADDSIVMAISALESQPGRVDTKDLITRIENWFSLPTQDVVGAEDIQQGRAEAVREMKRIISELKQEG